MKPHVLLTLARGTIFGELCTRARASIENEVNRMRKVHDCIFAVENPVYNLQTEFPLLSKGMAPYKNRRHNIQFVTAFRAGGFLTSNSSKYCQFGTIVESSIVHTYVFSPFHRLRTHSANILIKNTQETRFGWKV